MNLPEPAGGIHPMVWLILFLFFGPPALLSKGAAKLPSFLGAAARWWQAREPRSESYRISQAEIVRIRTDYQRILEDYQSMAKRMDTVEEELTKEKRRSWAAVGYIRQLIDFVRRHAPEADIPDPPELLRDIV